MHKVTFFRNGEQYDGTYVGNVSDIGVVLKRRFIDQIPSGYTIVISECDDEDA